MRIKIQNLSNPTSVQFPIVIVKGCVENYTQEVWKDAGTRTFLILHHQTSGSLKRCEEVEMEGLKFKLLVRLLPGENILNFDFLGIKDSLHVWYSEPTNEYTVRMVYVIPSDHDGKFQGPENSDCSVESAQQRILLAGELLQTVVAESLWDEGFGRKSFNLEHDVHILHSKLSTEECWTKDKESLWEDIGREIMQSQFKHKKCKYLAFLCCTKYVNPNKIEPLSFAQVLKMTKGYVALGGGGLGLFGTASLWTWPTHLSKVQTRLLDEQKIDSRTLMDDSAYRGTVGGMFATSLGSVLHELGHCFDLGHAPTGVMARGFDDLDLYLTLCSRKPVSTGRSSLVPCSNWKLSPEPQSDFDLILDEGHSSQDPSSPRFTSIRRTESVSKYLENYARRRYKTETSQSGCGVHWTEPCARILSRQKWIQISQCTEDKVYLQCINTTLCCDPDTLEIREAGGKFLRYWTGAQEILALEDEILENSVASGVVISECGEVVRMEFDSENYSIIIK